MSKKYLKNFTLEIKIIMKYFINVSFLIQHAWSQLLDTMKLLKAIIIFI